MRLKNMVGQKIHALRVNCRPKMSREKLAAACQVDASSIKRWENGVSWPEAENLERICEVFKKSPSYFFSDFAQAETDIDSTYSHAASLLSAFGNAEFDKRQTVLRMLGLPSALPSANLSEKKIRRKASQ